MEDKAASAMSLEYVRSSAFMETSPAPESLIQETNVDLSMKASSTGHHAASELPTQISEVTQSTTPKHKLRSMSQLMHRNWRKGLETGILIGIILIVWALFSIPTILYALPPSVKEV